MKKGLKAAKLRRAAKRNRVIAVLLFAAVASIAAVSVFAAGPGTDCTDTQSCLKTSPIVRDINMIVNFLSAGVAIIVIGSIVLGGIQYSAAGNKPESVAAARQRIANGLMAFGAFLLIYAFLQWLIPGGIFG